MIKINIFIYFLLLTTKIIATNQIHDTIIFKGHSYPVQYYLLDKFFELNPDKKINPDCVSTALWRGYIGTCEINDNQLFLKDITILTKKQGSEDCAESVWASVMKNVFPIQENIKVNWFTGILVLSYNLISQGDSAYSSIYEKYNVLEVDRGDIVKERTLSYDQYTIFKETQYQYFKKSNEYLKLKEKLGQSWNKQLLNLYLKEYSIGYVKKIIE